MKCEFCQVVIPEGEGFRITLLIGPERAAKLEARYGRPFSLDERLMAACETHRLDLVPHLISLGFIG